MPQLQFLLTGKAPDCSIFVGQNSWLHLRACADSWTCPELHPHAACFQAAKYSVNPLTLAPQALISNVELGLTPEQQGMLNPVMTQAVTWKGLQGEGHGDRVVDSLVPGVSDAESQR
jgi:hypothetical protein